MAGIPAETAYLQPGAKFKVSRRLDGGVRSQMRTRLPVIGQYQGDFRKKQGARGRKRQKALRHNDF